MKKIYLLSWLLVCINLHPALAQKNERDQDFVRFETPTVASFTKFIDHPVNIYNGTPDVSIPVYTLKDGAIEIPITLRYNTSGIKVNEEASWVGLGWNLNVGGVIVQNCVGKRDIPEYFNYNSDYYHNRASTTSYTSVPCNVGDKYVYDSFFHNAALGNLQPDAYYFSYPGNSGKFFIDYRDNSIHQMKKEKPVKIEYERIKETWKITTETGVIHSFGEMKTSNSEGSAFSLSATYYLKQTLYPNGQTVDYTYTEATIYSFGNQESQALVLRNNGSGGVADNPSSTTPENYYSIVKSTELILSSIKTNNYKIDFITSARTDLLNGLKLDEIRISALQSAWNVTAKKFKFNYDYFVTTTLGNYWALSSPFDIEKNKRRLKLLSVHEVVGTSTVHNKHSFEYDTQQLPVKTSYAVDYWGYFNGVLTNNTFLPDFSQLLNGSELGLQLARLQGKKATRAVNAQSSQAGILKKVTYPTGGYSTYTYQANQFYHSNFIPTISDLAPRSKSIIDRNNISDTRSYTFDLTSETVYNFSWVLEKGLNTWQQMSGSIYTITKSGQVIKSERISIPGAYDDLSRFTGEFALTLKPGTYTVTVDIPDHLGDQFGSMLNHGQLAMDISGRINRYYSEGAGLRVDKVDFFESTGLSVPTYSVAYEYGNPMSNGILYDEPYFHRLYNVKYAVIAGGVGSVSFIEQAEISGNSNCSAPYSSVGIVGYSHVRERVTGNGLQNGYKDYSFHNLGEISGSTMNVQIANPMNGLLSEIKYFNASGINVKSEKIKYTNTLKHNYWGVHLIDNFNRTPGFYSGKLVEYYDNGDHGNYHLRFSTMLYPITSYEILLTSKTTVVDGVTINESYTYNPYGLPTETTITQSDGKTNVTQTTYPTDYNCDIYQTMQNKNMLTFPVEERNIINGNLTSGKLTQYTAQGADVVPANISYAVSPSSGNPTGFSCSGVVSAVYPQQDIKILYYDARSNPIQVTRNDVKNTVYIWGYNYQYPVAKIENATYAQVKTALGDKNPESLSAAPTPDMTLLNGLRASLPNALITTYTYKPLLGIEAVTAPNGEISTYEYDSYGRLICIRDHNGKVTEEYKYNVRP